MAEKHRCPVCGKYEFEAYDCMDICDVCDWCDDAIQENDPDYRGGANKMSLNEAKEAYKNGVQIRCNMMSTRKRVLFYYPQV